MHFTSYKRKSNSADKDMVQMSLNLSNYWIRYSKFSNTHLSMVIMIKYSNFAASIVGKKKKIDSNQLAMFWKLTPICAE